MADDQEMDVDSPPSPQRMASPPVRRSPRLAARRVTSSPVVQLRAPRAGAARRPGRPKHMIWNYFNKVVDGALKAHAECTYCQVVIRSAQPGTNMQRHIKICVSAPANVKQHVRDQFPDFERPAQGTAAAAASGFAASNLPANGNTAQEAPEPMTAQMQQEFEMKLATMFYLCALPFSLVESTAFRAPFLLVAPWLAFPSRRKLSGDLLKKARKHVRKRAIERICQQRYDSIVTDSWTNTNHSTIINFMVVAPGMSSMFWSSLALGTASETAQYVADHIGRVIDEVERETGAVVAGVLTDNAANMTAAWEILERTRPIFGGGCSAHVLNLLIEDMCKVDFFKDVQSKALSITTYVRDHHAVLSQFQNLLRDSHSGHNRELSVPVSTRWYSVHACLSRVLENKSILQKLFTEQQFAALIKRSASSEKSAEKCRQVKGYLRDVRFWDKLEQVVGFIDPVIEALRELESDNCPASRVYSRFRDLINHPAYGTDDQQTPVQHAIKEIVQHRWNFVHTNAIGLAFLLDPHTDLDHFHGTDEGDTYRQGYAFAERSGILERLNVTMNEFNGALYAFAGGKRRWSDATKHSHGGVSPIDWWYANAKTYPMMWELAKLVFAIPTSSAASERAWSIMDFIHSKKRNRLSLEKVDMLAYIYVNDRGVGAEGAGWARLQSYPESHDALDRDD